LSVIWWWYSLKDLQSVQCLHTSLSLVRYHTSHCFEEHTTWGTKMEWTSGRLTCTPFAQILEVLQFISVEAPTDIDVFTSNYDNPLAC
jgi:hypothetical protein